MIAAMITEIIWASTRENLSSGFPTTQDLNYTGISPLNIYNYIYNYI